MRLPFHLSLIIPAMATGLALTAPTAQAQMGSNMLRAQTRMVESAISRNLDRVFRPKLVIREGATGPVTALALSSDEHFLVTAVGNRTLRVWDLWVGREVARLPGHAAKITAIAVSADGKRAITAAQDKTLLAWDLQTGTSSPLPAPDAVVSDLAVLGDTVLVASDDGSVRQIGLQDGQIRRDLGKLHGTGPVRLTVAQNGGSFATAGSDGMVKVWGADAAAPTATINTETTLTAIALDSTGTRLASGDDSGHIRLWTTGGAAQGRLPGHDRAIASVAFDASGTTLISGARDGGVGFWDLNSGKERAHGKHDAGVSFVRAAKDGSFALTGSEDGTTRLWNLNNGSTLLTLLSTEKGWAVIDAKGRYDGSQQALDGIDWQGDDATASIDDFAETHYEAALLPRTLQDGGSLAQVQSIPEGVHYPPVVAFRSPTAGVDGQQNRVNVEIQGDDQGGGVAELRLYRNGKLVPPQQGQTRTETIDGRARMIASFDIDLPEGNATLSATAVNTDRFESRPQVISLRQGQASKPGKLHLLTVGINSYSETRLNLDYARPDAQAIAGFIAGGGTPLPVAEEVNLTDQTATKEAIVAAIRKMRDVPAQDVVVIYLAGHGVSVGDDWYFISHEIQIPGRADRLKGMALSSAELKAEIEGLNAERTLLLLDTCHSGSAVSPLKDYRGMKTLRLIARSVGTHVLAATDRNQFAVELSKLGHGIFTYTLLNGLKGGADLNGDGKVSATELIAYAENQVPVLSRQYADYPQYPTGYSRGLDFVVSQR